MKRGGMRELFRRIGGALTGEPPVERHQAALRRDGHLVVGRHSYGEFRVRRHAASDPPVVIGAFCSLARDVEFMPGGGHDTAHITTFPLSRLGAAHSEGEQTAKGGITLGNDVWVGRGARILSGVSVGDGAVVGAHAVIASDVAPYAIVAGNPARLIRFRFPPDEISTLLAARWWDLDDSQVEVLAPLLDSDDVTAMAAAVQAMRS